MIWSARPGNTWSCSYVGDSDCLLIDMALHLVPKRHATIVSEMVMQTICGFSFAVIPSAEPRAAAAKYVHDALRPRFGHDPKCAPLPINLPDTTRVVERPKPEQAPSSDLFAKGVAKGVAKVFSHSLRDWLGHG